MNFRAVLDRLMKAPGAIAAAFLDPQGQPVARVGDRDTIEVLGAYQSVWLGELTRGASRARLGPLVEVSLDFEAGRVLASEVKDGYFLIVVFDAVGVPSISRARLEDARLELAAEIS